MTNQYIWTSMTIKGASDALPAGTAEMYQRFRMVRIKWRGNRKYGHTFIVTPTPPDQCPKYKFPHKPSKPRKQRKR